MIDYSAVREVPSRAPLPSAPLVPAALRAQVAVTAAAAAAVFLYLAALFAGGTSPAAVDLTVSAALHRAGLNTGTWSDAVTSLGDPLTVVVVAGVVAVLALGRGRHLRLAALAVLGPGVTGLVTSLAKPLIGRRIADGSLSFPSGHTAGVTAICLLVGAAVVATARRRAIATTAVLAVTVVAACVVGAGLVVEHAHYPTDVIGGFCVAVAVTAAAAMAIDAVAARIVRRRHRTLIDRTSSRPTVF